MMLSTWVRRASPWGSKKLLEAQMSLIWTASRPVSRERTQANRVAPQLEGHVCMLNSALKPHGQNSRVASLKT